MFAHSAILTVSPTQVRPFASRRTANCEKSRLELLANTSDHGGRGVGHIAGLKNASNDAGAITFSGTLSGTLVGARSRAGAGAGVLAGIGITGHVN
jgi:hypothetical protein